MLTHPLLALRQGHLDRLRTARRRGSRALLGRRALHLRGLRIAAARSTESVRRRELSGDTRIARVTAERAAALTALMATAAGDSLCTLSRERLSAAKYHEGAVAALGDAMRAVQADRTPPESATWGAQWQRLADSDPGWRAYLAGGREALGRLS